MEGYSTFDERSALMTVFFRSGTLSLEEFNQYMMRQILPDLGIDFEARSSSKSVVVSSSHPFFLSAPVLRQALEGILIPDKRDGVNSARFETSIPLLFGSFYFIESGVVSVECGLPFTDAKSFETATTRRYAMVLLDCLELEE